ncbi:MAG: M50 family metallopeptidase [Clostridia bacterium]|nr:M50 family metallopeptidase [Clostridia bacterium]
MGFILNLALIIIGVLLFCVIILVHEFGHFSMAKLFSVKVNEFSIGMGPKLFRKQKGETLYTIRALPIGGFCAMEGEDEESDSDRAFGNKKAWQKILIVAMGGILNVILGFIMMFIILIPQEAYATTTVAHFSENASTQSSGLMLDDRITSFDGYKINCDRDLMFAFSISEKIREAIKSDSINETYIDMTVNRNGQHTELKNVRFEIATAEDGTRYLNLDFKVYGEQKTFLNTIEKAFNYTVSTVRMVWASLVGIVMGKFGVNDMAGPIGTASVISQSAAAGLAQGFSTAVLNIVYIMIILTVNLGVFNLLPIPALDGGRLVFLIFELIFRKPVAPKFEKYVHAIGFVALIAFMIFITCNDILRLITGNGAFI